MPRTAPSLHLASVTLREINLPLVEPFRTAGGVVDARRVLLASLTGPDGEVAWSECVAESLPSYGADTVDTCWLALTEWLLPAALGRPFRDGPEAHALLSGVRGHQMARATIEMGCWLLLAEREQVALAVLLGRAVGAAPRERVATGLALGFQPTPAVLAERVQAAVESGYRRVKVKIEVGRDLSWADAALRAAAGRTAVSVDANCAYSLDDPSHVATLRELDGLGLAMIEQPLAHDDMVRHAELQRLLRTPLCLDESVTGAASAATAIALRSARLLNVKPGRVAGFTEALQIHAAAQAAGIGLWVGGMLETGIGRAFNVALAALPGFTEPGDLSPSARYWSRDIVTPPWTMDDAGHVGVPLARAGLGVTVDVDRIDDLTVRARTVLAR